MPKGLFIILIFLLLLVQSCGGGGGGGGGSASTVGGGGGSTTSAPSSMSTGDIVSVDLSGGSATVSFSGTGSSSSFELLVQARETSGSTNSITLSSLSDTGKSLGLGSSLEEMLLEDAYDPQTRFDSLLRDEENFLTQVPLGSAAAKYLSQSKGQGDIDTDPNIDVALSVGDENTFRVLTSLTDVTQYATVTGKVKCVNSEVAIFLDTEVESTNPDDLTQANLDSLCSTYSTQLVSLRSYFGTYSDINADGVAVALITPQVNRLTSSGGGIITGFFYSGDFFSRSDSIPASNEREIVYMLTPDSGGVYGTKVTNAFAMSNFLPAVFPHEMQHLISYYQHTIARTGSAEASWLNEGLSHLAEDLVGQGRENYSRYDLFLASPQSYALTPSGSPGLAQRGASYLFLRYLYEQSGKSTTFLNNLVQTTRTGVSNVEGAYPSPPSDFNEMDEFLKNWGVALAYSNRGLTSNSRFTYNARTVNSTTNNYEGACMICQAGDGRSTVLSGPVYGTYNANTTYGVKGSATRFLRFSTTPSTITFQSSTSATPGAMVLRTQ